jgi:hypothetical protein
VCAPGHLPQEAKPEEAVAVLLDESAGIRGAGSGTCNNKDDIKIEDIYAKNLKFCKKKCEDTNNCSNFLYKDNKDYDEINCILQKDKCEINTSSNDKWEIYNLNENNKSNKNNSNENNSNENNSNENNKSNENNSNENLNNNNNNYVPPPNKEIKKWNVGTIILTCFLIISIILLMFSCGFHSWYDFKIFENNKTLKIIFVIVCVIFAPFYSLYVITFKIVGPQIILFSLPILDFLNNIWKNIKLKTISLNNNLETVKI